MFNKLRKMAIVAVTAGALMLAGGIAQAENAKPDSIIDPAKAPGSIHLVKYDDADQLTKPTGQNDFKPKNAKPVGGIEFRLTQIEEAPEVGKIGEAITQNDKILELSKLRASDAVKKSDGWKFGKVITKTTGSDGKIDFSDLQLGVYLLEETKSVSTEGKKYKAAAPSLVFLPTTDPKGTKWIEDEQGKYTVYIYPKNSLNENIKTVEDANKQAGDTVTYTITATVPAVQLLEKNSEDGRKYNLKDFGFWDTLDERLEMKDTASVAVKIAEQTLSPTDDYVAKVHNNKLSVVLTAKGLDRVAEAKIKNSSVLVSLSFKPTVVKSGLVPNKALVYKNAGEGKGTVTPDTPEPPKEEPREGMETNVVVSGWGKIKITKTGESSETKLGGAEFQVYGIDSKGKKTGPLTVGNKNTWTTAEKTGEVVIDGLHATNLADFKNVAEVKSQYISYELVETKAPDGYELNRKPIPFKIEVRELDAVKKQSSWVISSDGNKTITSQSEEAKKISLDPIQGDGPEKMHLFAHETVVNIKTKPKLPLTGGAGIAVFGLLGAAIIGGGIFAAKRNAKKA